MNLEFSLMLNLSMMSLRHRIIPILTLINVLVSIWQSSANTCGDTMAASAGLMDQFKSLTH